MSPKSISFSIQAMVILSPMKLRVTSLRERQPEAIQAILDCFTSAIAAVRNDVAERMTMASINIDYN